MKLNEIAEKILQKRYYQEGEDWEALCHRVAEHITTDIDKRANYFEIMYNLRFLPNSPTLMNAGKKDGQLFACFALPVEDSMESIFQTLKDTAMIHKSGGGTGFNFSKLRAKNSKVNSTNGVASGAISFMEVYNASTEAVKQGGTRRGANMGILNIDHPDIDEFIDVKSDLTKLTNFNLSVGITDEFMKAVKEDRGYYLKDPQTGRVILSSLRPAREVFDKIVQRAYNTGEPGLLFLDTINKDEEIVKAIGRMEITNPCGELPLLPYEACVLGSFNLSKYVDDEGFNFNAFEEDVYTATKMLNDIIDTNCYPLPQIKDTVMKNRKIGIGIMGFADALIKLGKQYGSKESLEFIQLVMSCVRTAANEMSNFLGIIHGFSPDGAHRNITRLTIAPTGTISMLAGCSSGIEPLYALAFIRNQADMELLDVNLMFEQVLKDRGIYSEELIKKVIKLGTIQDIDEIPADIKKLFVTAHDISPTEHIVTQAEFQKYVDNSISKTINFSNNATKEDIAKAFMMAWELGCKGTTVYRDGSRFSQTLNIGEVKKAPDLCPDCGKELVKKEGCSSCECGFSKCG